MVICYQHTPGNTPVKGEDGSNRPKHAITCLGHTASYYTRSKQLSPIGSMTQNKNENMLHFN